MRTKIIQSTSLIGEDLGLRWNLRSHGGIAPAFVNLLEVGILPVKTNGQDWSGLLWIREVAYCLYFGLCFSKLTQINSKLSKNSTSDNKIRNRSYFKSVETMKVFVIASRLRQPNNHFWTWPWKWAAFKLAVIPNELARTQEQDFYCILILAY